MLRLILAASETEPATAVSIAAVTFSEPAWMSAARTLAVSACFFTNSRAASGTSMFWSFVKASVTGAKASLTLFSTELVSVVIGGLSILRFELWAHPVRSGPGRHRCVTANGATQHRYCVAISRIRDQIDCWAVCQGKRRKFHFSLTPDDGRAAGGRLHPTLHGVVFASLRPALKLDGPGEPVGLHLCPHLRHVVPEHDDIVLLAVDVPDMVPQQGFGLEAEALEQRDRCLLVDRHLHRELFEAGAERQRKGLLRQRPADALAAHVQRHHHPDLSDMGRPGMRVTHQRAAADHRAVLHRQQALDLASFDLVDPGRQHFWLADIARQEQQIVGRQFLREGEHGRLVGAGHQAEFDLADIGLDMPRIGTCFTHVDLLPNQLSSFGHSRLIALGPATRLTWPPFSITSSLSIEPPLVIRCLAAS